MMERENRLHRKTLQPAVVLLLLLFLVPGCGGPARQGISVEEKSSAAETNVSSEGFNHFINADLLEMFGAYPEAIIEYENALRYFPNSNLIRTDYARLLFRAQRLGEARAVAASIQPKSSEIYTLIADCYRMLGQVDSAVSTYRQAVALDSNNLNAYWYLAGFYRESGQTDSAIAAYYELVRLSDTYRLWHELGTMLGKNARYPEALTAFRRSISIDSSKANITAFMGLAATLDAMDSVMQAELALTRAAALDPYDVRVFRQMQAMYIGRNQIKKAIVTSELLVSLLPDDWMMQRRLGVLLYGDGQLERADSLFRSRIEAGDEDALNYFYRGRVAVEQERNSDARSLFEKVTEKESGFVDGWLSLGFVLRELDSIPKALETFRQGLISCTGNQERIRLLFALGSLQERSGQFDESFQSFRELLAIDSMFAPALNYLGYMLADRGEQLDYAKQLIERALTLEPDNGAYIDSYGWVEYRLGNFEKALSELKRAAAMITTDAVVYEHLGDVYRAMGNTEEAIRQYQRALEIDPQNATVKEKLKQ